MRDGNILLESVVLYAVGHEWGDWGNSKAVEVRISSLAPGAHALIWRDDDSAAELRTDLSRRVRPDGRDVNLNFEFPKLYRLRNLKTVAGLGKPGYQVAARRVIRSQRTIVLHYRTCSRPVWLFLQVAGGVPNPRRNARLNAVSV